MGNETPVDPIQLDIIYPDNPRRRARAAELITAAQVDLSSAQDNYIRMLGALDRVHVLIGETYKKIGKPIPPKESIAVGDVPENDTIIKWSKALINAGIAAGSLRFLTPAIVKSLVRQGLMTEAKAGKLIFKWVITEGEDGLKFSLTVGEAVGGFLAGMVAAAANVAIDALIDAIEGAIAKPKLIRLVRDSLTVRARLRVVRVKSEALLNAIQSIETALIAARTVHANLTEADIEALIHDSMQYFLQIEKHFGAIQANAQLIALDNASESYRADDAFDEDWSQPLMLIASREEAVLDLWDSSKDVGAPVKVVSASGRHGGDNQRWNLEFLEEVKYWRIRSAASKLPLDIRNADVGADAPVIQWHQDPQGSQLWVLTAAGPDTFFIVNRKSGLVIGINPAEDLWGATVQQQEPDGSPGQVWKVG